MNMPKKVGLYGPGEVILKSVYLPSKSLEAQGIIKIITLIGRGNLEDRIKKLEERARRNPLEKEAAEDIIKRLTNQGNDKPIKYSETDGKSLNPNLLNDVDFFYLATPTNIRTGPIEQLAKAGIPGVIEKPLGKTKEEINRIVNIIEKYGIKAICAEHYSYKEPSLEFFKTFKKKTRNFGKINSIEAVLEESDFLEAKRCEWLLNPSINGGGIWIDTGVHMMHLVYMTGARMMDVISAKSYRYQFPTGDERNGIIRSETAADVIFRIEGNDGRIAKNAFAHIRVAKCMQRSQKYFKVCFDKGEVFLDFENNSISFTDRTGLKGVFRDKILPKTKPYANMMSAFVDYLDDDKKVPPTIIPRVKESMDATFEVYSKMKKGDPRDYY